MRAAIGVSGLTVHSLRHTSATLAATLAELQAHVGHPTPNMAMRYQHVAADRDVQLAQRMSSWPPARTGALHTDLVAGYS